MSRDERLDALEHRLMACKCRVLAGTSHRDRIEIGRELRALGKELERIPRPNISAGWNRQNIETQTKPGQVPEK